MLPKNRQISLYFQPSCSLERSYKRLVRLQGIAERPGELCCFFRRLLTHRQFSDISVDVLDLGLIAVLACNRQSFYIGILSGTQLAAYLRKLQVNGNIPHKLSEVVRRQRDTLAVADIGCVQPQQELFDALSRTLPCLLLQCFKYRVE